MITYTATAHAELIPGNCFGTFKLPDEVAFVTDRGEGSNLWTTDGRRGTILPYRAFPQWA